MTWEDVLVPRSSCLPTVSILIYTLAISALDGSSLLYLLFWCVLVKYTFSYTLGALVGVGQVNTMSTTGDFSIKYSMGRTKKMSVKGIETGCYSHLGGWRATCLWPQFLGTGGKRIRISKPAWPTQDTRPYLNKSKTKTKKQKKTNPEYQYI